jgi:predicted Zn-dependent peptidase
LSLYQQVTKEDIMRVSKQYLTKENRLVVDYLPKSEENK